MIAVLGYCLWAFRFLITDELPRMEPWQRYVFWLGDLSAIVSIVAWAFRSPRTGSVSQTYARAVTALIGLALLADVSVTLFHFAQTDAAMKRSVPVSAEVLYCSIAPWKQSKHIRFDLQFIDETGSTHKGVVKLTSIRGQDPPWKERPLAIAESDGKAKRVDVQYDPHRPARVWLAGQPFGSTTGLAPAFAVIHIAQLIFVFSMIQSIWQTPRCSLSTMDTLPVIPIAIQAAILLVLSFTLHLGG
jgi:hypothetical protein